MNQNQYFFGFSTFEEFLAASPTKQIYLSKSVVDSPNEMNIIHRTWQVTAAAIANGVCHYWRMKLGGDQVKYAEAVSARSVSLQRELSAIARDNGYSVIHGLISIPRDVVVMTGGAASLEYDRESNSFIRKIEPEQQPETEQEKLAA